jgi:Na+-transporting NADH:ubiquinone oxidoreductase subunit NqrC
MGFRLGRGWTREHRLTLVGIIAAFIVGAFPCYYAWKSEQRAEQEKAKTAMEEARIIKQDQEKKVWINQLTRQLHDTNQEIITTQNDLEEAEMRARVKSPTESEKAEAEVVVIKAKLELLEIKKAKLSQEISALKASKESAKD